MASPDGSTRDHRPVAVLVDAQGEYQQRVIRGIESVLSEHQIAAVVVVAHPEDFTAGDSLAHLLSPKALLGVIATGTAVARFMHQDSDPGNPLRDLPVVLIGAEQTSISSVRADNEVGMRELLQHLAAARPLRDIVLLRGRGEGDAAEREQVVRDSLARRGISLPEDLVLDGNFERLRAYRELSQLLDRHRTVDAVIACNDQMAYGALDALAERGLRVPEDVLVTGFDDESPSRSTRPALTTVDPHQVDQGAQAARLLLERAEGRPPRQIVVPARLIARRSCGETPGLGVESVFAAVPRPRQEDPKPVQTPAYGLGDVFEVSDQVLATVEGLGAPPVTLPDGWARRLSELAWHAVENSGDPRPLLAHVLPLLWRTAETNGDLRWWSETATGLLVALLAQAADPGQQIRAAMLHGSFTGQIAEARHEAWLDARRHDLEDLDQALQLHTRLGECVSLEDLVTALVVGAPGIGIHRLFLALFEQEAKAPEAKARLMLGYRDGTVDETVTGAVFPSGRLLPPALSDELTRGVLTLQPLTVGQHRYGFLVYERRAGHLLVEESLCRDVAAALDAMSRRTELSTQRDELQRLVVGRTRRLKLETVSLLGRNVPSPVADAAASVDPLTSLPDRTAFDLHLARQWNRMRVEGRPVAVLLVDLDLFADFNDRYGHEEGDAALRRVAKAIMSAARRPGDLAARFGGERFAVLLPGTPAAGAAEVARRLHTLVRSEAVPYPDGALGAVLTVSTGVAALVPHLALEPADLLEAADSALHLAKGLGRDRWSLAESDSAEPVDLAL